MNKFVLTGGPGVGKSSLIEALCTQGYSTVGEAARQVILEEQEKRHFTSPEQWIPYFRSRLLREFPELNSFTS